MPLSLSSSTLKITTSAKILMIMFTLGFKIRPEPYKRVVVEDFGLESSVESLRDYSAKIAGLQSSEIELVFRGKVLNDLESLKELGINPGMTIHVLRRVSKGTSESETKTSKGSDKDIAEVFRRLATVPNFKSTLRTLLRTPKTIDSMIEASPTILEDPAAMGLLQDPELVKLFTDSNTFKKATEAHPALNSALPILIKALREGLKATASSSSDTSAGYHYSLDAPSDNDDENQGIGESQQNNSLQPITAEMLNQALGEAIRAANMNTQGTSGGQPATQTELRQDLEATTNRLEAQLRQMHELGLTNDTINMQALQATDWNVQEAINLVFAGVLTDEADME